MMNDEAKEFPVDASEIWGKACASVVYGIRSRSRIGQKPTS